MCFFLDQQAPLPRGADRLPEFQSGMENLIAVPTLTVPSVVPGAHFVDGGEVVFDKFLKRWAVFLSILHRIHLGL